MFKYRSSIKLYINCIKVLKLLEYAEILVHELKLEKNV